MKKNNKIIKFFIGIGTFFTGLISKVYAFTVSGQTKYGIREPKAEDNNSIIGKILLFVLIFIIGLIIILNKKLTKKVKAIIISAILLLGVLGFVLINYFANN